MADTAPTWAGTPALVGRFQLGEELARGGMGVVYRASEPAIGREVAVKLINDQSKGDPRAVARFLAEARITGQLQHPGIPPVFEVGQLPDGSPFLAMKLIKGRTLEDLLKDRPDPSHARSKFVAIFEQICQAVGYAHSHKVIHRDLKAANVMVGAYGEVQVMDWGIAKVLTESQPFTLGPEEATIGTAIRSLRESDHETRAGSAMGTPQYMPQEQAIGAVDQMDERSDVFGLGGILCMILTGQPPYVAASGEAARQMAARGELTDAFARLDRCGSEPELVVLCRRCLSLAKGDRPKNAGDVAKAVAELRAAADERARQAELDRAKAEVRAAEQRKQRRVQLALFGSVGLLVLACGAFAWWQDRQATAERNADERRQLEEDARRNAEAERRARNAEVTGYLLQLCEQYLRDRHWGEARKAFSAVEARIPEGGLEPLAPRLDRCRADVMLFEQIGDLMGRWGAANFDAREYRKEFGGRWVVAFERYGIAPGVTPVGAVRERIDRSNVPKHVVQALKQWYWQTGSAELQALADSSGLWDAGRGVAERRWNALHGIAEEELGKKQKAFAETRDAVAGLVDGKEERLNWPKFFEAAAGMPPRPSKDGEEAIRWFQHRMTLQDKVAPPPRAANKP